jgi:hypothetical protein
MNTDFTMYAGDTRFLRFECINEVDNTPIDLSNAQDMNFSITTFGGGSDNKLVTKTVGQIGIENTNVAVVVLNESDTEDLRGKFQYYFQVTDFGGDNFTTSGLCIINVNGI